MALVLAKYSQVFALGADYGPDELKMRAGLIGGQTPVHGYWVNWEDVFFYAGDAEAFNKFILDYSKFEHRLLKVEIHRGAKQAASPWRQLDVPADWSFYVWNTGATFTIKYGTNEIGEQEADFVPLGTPAPTRVDVWVGPRLKLAELKIPAALGVTAGIEAASDAEIQAFVAGRQAQATAGSRDLAAEQPKEPIRVDLKLSDGSRLRGETSDLQNLPLQSVLGDTLVPIEQLQSIERIPDDTGRAARVRLRNGDRLTGVIGAHDWHDLKLSTALGQITVPAAVLRGCEIETSMRATPISIRASSSWEVSVPERAFDGRRDSDWNSGNYAPAWIEADLGAATRLIEIVLVPGQDIAGMTTHEVWISAQPMGDDRTNARLVHTFHGETANSQRLGCKFPEEVTARYVQVRTTQSPTWISWWEVEIRKNP